MSWHPDLSLQFVPDRDSRVLTYQPAMKRALPPPPERNSIYGDTYDGVPNPNVAVTHGYPTRFHGPIWAYPMPGYTYVPTPYTKAPFLGFGQAESGITTRTLLFVGAGAALFWAIAKDRGNLAGMKPETAAIAGGAIAALLASMS